MRLLAYDEDEIARSCVGHLVGLALESDVVPLHGTARDIQLERLSFPDCTLALAPLALVLVFVDGSGALAALARHDLALHQGAELAEAPLHALTIATLALVGPGLLVLAARPVALDADDLLLRSKFDSLALVELLERGSVGLLLVRAALVTSTLRLPSWAAHAVEQIGELGEDIAHVRPATGTAAFRWVEGVHAIAVVQFALLIVAEDVSCLRDELELDLGFLALFRGHFVGVTLYRKLDRMAKTCDQRAAQHEASEF